MPPDRVKVVLGEVFRFQEPCMPKVFSSPPLDWYCRLLRYVLSTKVLRRCV
jgi:hypothetical protein